jgi:hypothetical protein
LVLAVKLTDMAGYCFYHGVFVCSISYGISV